MVSSSKLLMLLGYRQYFTLVNAPCSFISLGRLNALLATQTKHCYCKITSALSMCLSDHLIPCSTNLCMQDGDYADDPLLETYLQLLAVDRSKVIFYGLLRLLCRLEKYTSDCSMTVNDMILHMGSHKLYAI